MPVDVITHEQIASSGYTETAQVIQSLAPSFNFPRPTITDGTDTVRPATLRGLGPDQVLVLINGKRRHQSALVHVNGSIGRGSTGVDLNAIPVSAIDHIEVLRDGAAAQYGSDAIAGVINIVLKGGVARPDVTSKFGLSTGSFIGNTCTSNGLGCTDGQPHRLFGRRAVRSRRRRGACAAGKGSVTVAAEYRHHNRTNRASFDPRDQIVAGDAGNNAVAEPNHRWGDPDTRDLMTFRQRQRAAERARKPVSSTASAATAAATANSAGFYRRALDARNWPQIYPLGFLPTIEPTVVDALGNGGRARRVPQVELRRQRPVRTQQLCLHDRRHLERVARPDACRPTRPQFDAGTLELNQFVGNVDVSRPFARRVASPARSTSRSAREYRRENYQIQAGRAGLVSATAACRIGSASVPRSARRSSPAFVRPTRSTSRATAAPGTWTSKATSSAGCASAWPAARSTTATSAARVDGKLTARVQLGSAVRRARLGQHRLPRAVARAVVLLVDRDQLPEPRAGAGAGGVADAAGRLGAGAGPRRGAAQAGELAARQRRRRRHADPGARRHGRLLPHRHRRPHRAVRQLHRAADCGAAGAVRRQQRAVLHQCDRHARPTAST